MAKPPPLSHAEFVCGDIGDIVPKPWAEEVIYERIKAAPGVWAWERKGES